MARTIVRTISTSGTSRKIAASRRLVRKASALLRARSSRTPRAPFRTGGFYGLYSRRGRDELKVIDSGSNITAVPSAGQILLINGVSQGTDYNARIGRKILLKSLLVRFTLTPNSGVTNGSVGDIVRIMIVYDSQTNGTQPVVADILQTSTFDDPINLTNRDRFKILTDKFLTMGAFTMTGTPALATGSPQPKYFKIYKKFNLDVIFGGTGNTVGSVQTGGIFLFIMSLNNQITNLTHNSRIRFIDS